MSRRGDVVLIDFPFAAGEPGKVRPALVVQNDLDNQRLDKTVVAMITSNLRHGGDATHVLIDPASPEGDGSGLQGPSLVACLNLFTIHQSAVQRTLGRLSPAAMQKVNECLKAGLGLA
jgi:mRNA interferase MazF